MNGHRAYVTSQITLSGSFQTVYQNISFSFLFINRIHICNTSASPVTVQICFVPQSGSPGQSNAALWNFTVAANDFIEWGKDEILPQGTTISALASTASVVNVFLSAMGQ